MEISKEGKYTMPKNNYSVSERQKKALGLAKAKGTPRIQSTSQLALDVPENEIDEWIKAIHEDKEYCIASEGS